MKIGWEISSKQIFKEYGSKLKQLKMLHYGAVVMGTCLQWLCKWVKWVDFDLETYATMSLVLIYLILN